MSSIVTRPEGHQPVLWLNDPSVQRPLDGPALKGRSVPSKVSWHKLLQDDTQSCGEDDPNPHSTPSPECKLKN